MDSEETFRAMLEKAVIESTQREERTTAMVITDLKGQKWMIAFTANKFPEECYPKDGYKK